MSKIGVMLAAGILTVGIGGIGIGSTVGAGDAEAVVGPRIAVAADGVTNWQITYDKGDARRTDCTLFVAGKRVVKDSASGSVTLPGAAVTAGRHAVQMRCGAQVSPTLWLYAPRGQINDIATWGSNFTAGILGF
ncbi:hypothetical protein QSJ18_12600 [Gordonia sp. ABSL1-1]|uniref:hypothetical protein n=1 Tax=Gordonia sp. ABSL1-1 TaxID=3053923 RepID=UPI0025745B85|nr:hypothetical protein [Gordonia sp. ABSL1-1]MDL9937588.1 hypothetical protein [Gordonia sp. ABSL1-1]